MSAPPYDLRRALSGFSSAWQGFFFSPVDARLCAVLRIGYAICVLINLASFYPDLERWFADSGVLPKDAVFLLQQPERWSLLMWLPEGMLWLQIVFWLFVLSAALLLLGVCSRLQTACVLVWLMSFQNRNTTLFDGEDVVLRLIGWYLLLVPVGAAWSLDAWWRKERVPLVVAPGVRLLQLQMALIFLTAAWCKLNGEQWRSGVVLFMVAQLDDYFGRLPLPAWMFETPWLVKSLTWSVIALELIVPIGIWFRQWRRPMLLTALVFHLGTEATMHLFLFHWVMLVGWCAFLLPEDFNLFGRSRAVPLPAGEGGRRPDEGDLQQQSPSMNA